ncbi:MAG: hypothetical protein JNM44_02630 [Chitinophagaceae bacterium]|nr:hypothetical protein [Chitinophagaceae bacterium]
MNIKRQYYPVNWVDGMKINKDHFIAQDHAWQQAIQESSATYLNPVRYGLLPAQSEEEINFDVRIVLDNQNTVRAHVVSLHAITRAGIPICIPALGQNGLQTNDEVPAVSFALNSGTAESVYWVVLFAKPFERQAAGQPLPDENPPRLPFLIPTYELALLSDAQYRQQVRHPHVITLGKVLVNGNDKRVDDGYIPPCLSVSAHPDLLSLHAELDAFLSNIEVKCSAIVQKIFKRSQQNELSDLVLFLCDRMILFLSQVITDLRWRLIHESPASLFAVIASMARVMKNSIDLRTGSGKDELLNYFSEWCDLTQGEWESMLSQLAVMRYEHNDVNNNILQIARFVKVSGKLFDTLSTLEFIGKRKESGIFVKEEREPETPGGTQKPKRRFFGG